MELLVDHRWLLARQEDILRSDLTVNDLSVLVGMSARHRVNTPRLDQGDPDAFWRAAVSWRSAYSSARCPRAMRHTGTAWPSPTWRPPGNAWTRSTSCGAS